MKKLLPGILAAVLAVGFSAFTTEKSSTANFDWRSAINPGDNLPNSSRADAIIHYVGCDEGAELCAEAYQVNSNVRAEAQDLLFNP